MKRTLYDIDADIEALAVILEEAGGDISDEDQEAAIDAWLAELGAERKRKIDGYCALIREWQARATARSDEAARLMALATTDSKNAERLKERLRFHMEQRDERRIETDRFKIARRRNGGSAPLRITGDGWREDPRFARVEADKSAMRHALESGEVLDWAELGERGEHLSIR